MLPLLMVSLFIERALEVFIKSWRAGRSAQLVERAARRKHVALPARPPHVDAIDRSGMYSVMGYLVAPHWGIAVLFAGIGMVLSNKVLVPAMGVLFALAAWRAWWAFPVFGLAYLAWNAGKRRWDDDGDPKTIPWYARYCHGAWHHSDHAPV